MKTLKKFTTFDDLKSCEKKGNKLPSSVKNHNDFKKVILEIRAIKESQSQLKR
jgi:hypothetical protein